MARLFVGLAFWCCLSAAAHAAAPPGGSLRLPPEVSKEIRESSRQWERAKSTARLEDTASALPIGARAATQMRAVLGDHPYVANMLARLADWAEDAGQWDRAIGWHQEVLRLRTKLYPAEDWRTVNARLDLADARRKKAWTPGQHRQQREIERLREEGIRLSNEGDYDQGLKCLRSALELTEKLYGKRHREVVQRLSNLGGVLRDRADFAPVEELLLR